LDQIALAGGCWSKRLVSNWIDSGGAAPPPWTDEDWENRDPENRQGPARRWRAALIIAFALLLLGLASQLGHARDRGQFANVNPDLRAWFNALKSGKGPCCSDADGSAISDADWESGNGHYRVRIDGEWVNVPDEAVITEPNRVGRTMVWPIRDGVGGLYIRCFMPGSMT
jgi:hypothetical protein